MAKPLLRPLAAMPQPFLSQIPCWSIREIEGRLVEISEPFPTASLSFAFMLVQEVHEEKQLAAWISLARSIFFLQMCRITE